MKKLSEAEQNELIAAIRQRLSVLRVQSYGIAEQRERKNAREREKLLESVYSRLLSGELQVLQK